jgi:serine/threonine-protein kinase RsbW
MNSRSPFQSRHGDARRARRRGDASARTNGGDVRLTLPARPENVAVVRHVLGAFAQALELPPRLVEDMRLAITEACANVVRHAYRRDEPGALEVTIRPGGDGLQLVVTDRGRGIEPSPDGGGAGLGLPMIAALADSLEIHHARSGGSRVAMSFRCRPGTVAE